MNLQQVRHVDDAITSRHSVRAFLNKAVDPQIIKDILTVASRAPSGTNTQPWKVYGVTGKKRDEMVERVCKAQMELNTPPELVNQYKETFAYYPKTGISPFIERRRENGWDLCGLLNIQKVKKNKWRASNCATFSYSMRLSLYILP